MTPLDLRNETWESLQSRVHGLRLRVLNAFRLYGPGTTRDVARRIGMDILLFRPRTTELYQLGFLRLMDRAGHHGVYQALSDSEAMALFQQRKQETAAGYQPELNLSPRGQ